METKKYETRDKFLRFTFGLSSVLFIAIMVLFSQGYSGGNNTEFKSKYEIIYVGENFEGSEVKRVSKEHFTEKYKLKVPHYVFVDYDYIEDDKLSDEFLNNLVDDGHSVLFIGENLNPEAVVGKFLDFGLAVVPLEAPSEIFYHLYGITYNHFDEIYIPLFYATVDENEVLDIDPIVEELHMLELELDSLQNES